MTSRVVEATAVSSECPSLFSLSLSRSFLGASREFRALLTLAAALSEVSVARNSDLAKKNNNKAAKSQSAESSLSQLPAAAPNNNVVGSYFSQSNFGLSQALSPTQNTQSNSADPTTPLPSYRTSNINDDLVITLTDLGSKFGTFTSDDFYRMPANEPTVLSLSNMGSGIVKVGAYGSRLRITRIPLVLCVSAAFSLFSYSFFFYPLLCTDLAAGAQ